MIRPFTLICALFAMGAGLYLYQSKHEAQMLDRKIAAIVRATDETRTRIGMLRADYQLLNDPTRLQDLADKNLTLRAIAPTQFTTLAELARRLPPVELAPPAAPDPVAEPEAGLFVPPAEAVAEPPPAPVAAPPKLAVATPARPVAPPMAVQPTPPAVAPKPARPAPEPIIQATPLPSPTPRHPSPPPSVVSQPPPGQAAVQQASAIRPVSDTRPAFVSALGMARTVNRAPTIPTANFPADSGGGR